MERAKMRGPPPGLTGPSRGCGGGERKGKGRGNGEKGGDLEPPAGLGARKPNLGTLYHFHLSFMQS